MSITVRLGLNKWHREMKSLLMHYLIEGVQYIEIRSLDLNPFSPFGVSVEQLRFIEVFFIYCLLGEDVIIDRKEREEIDFNEYEVSHHGRKEELFLRHKGESVSLKDWAKEIFIDLSRIAECMDKTAGNKLFGLAVSRFYSSVESIDQTYSAKILAAMRENNLSYYGYIESLGKQYCQFYSKAYKADDDLKVISDKVQESLKQQRVLEENDQQDFKTFLDEYFSKSYVSSD